MPEPSRPALSDLERAIIAHLQRDGRISFRTLATELGVTETMIYRHAQQLMHGGYFQVIGVVDPLALGQGDAVLAGIGCDPMAARSVAAALSARPETRFVALVTGTFDVVCELVISDRAHLTRMLVEILPAIQGVRDINTSWVLHNYITHYLWDIPMLPDSHAPVPERDQDHFTSAGLAPDGVPVDAGAHEAIVAPTNGIELDSTDHDVVRLLQQNGRISYAEIAGALGITESTARRRALRLLQSNHVRVVAISNPFLLGFQDVVLIWFKIDLGRLSAVAAELSRQAAIRYLSRTAGAVDLVAEALFRNHADLFAFLNGPLAAVAGIREVSISFELALYKRAYRHFDIAEASEGKPSTGS